MMQGPSPLQPFILYEALQSLPSDIMDVIIFKHSVLTVSIFLLWTAGLTDGSDVTQTDMLWETQGESATMSCTHTKGVATSRCTVGLREEGEDIMIRDILSISLLLLLLS
ncbi:hypothetical protein KUCAC02_026556, partial [Chaenocephalus aceratus]